MRIYGESSMLGLEVDKDTKQWIVQNNSPILNDVGIFTKTGETVISDGTRKNELVTSLLQLKSAILFSTNYDSLPVSITNIISEEEYKSLINGSSYNISVSKWKPSYSFIGYSGLLQSKAEINGGNGKTPLVYRIVAQFKLKDGTSAQITLGQMANPEIYKNNIDKIKGVAQKRLAEYNEITKDMDQEQKDNYNSINKTRIDTFKLIITEGYLQNKVQEYQNKLDKLFNKWNENKGTNDNYELFYPITSVKQTYTSAIREVKNGGFVEVTENGKTVSKWKDWGESGIDRRRLMPMNENDPSFTSSDNGQIKSSNPYLRVSKVYIGRASKEGNNNIKGLGGRAYIFVSRNLNLSSEELCKIWCTEEANKTPHTVRRIKLDNTGVSLSQLSTNSLSKIFRTENIQDHTYNKLPFENITTGIRQWIALHNFRANLLKFNTAYKIDFTEDANTMNLALQDLHQAYINYTKSFPQWQLDSQYNTIQKQFQAAFEGSPNCSKELANRIWNFNNSLDSKGIKQFRLGNGNINSKGELNHWQIRRMDVSASNGNYTLEQINKGVNGIYIDPTGYNTIYDIIDPIYTSLKQALDLSITKDNKVLGDTESVDVTKKVLEKVKAGKSEGFIGIGNEASDRNPVKSIPIALLNISTRALKYGNLKENEVWNNDVNNLLINEYTINSDNKAELKTTHSINMKKVIDKGSDVIRVLSLCFHGTSNKFIDSALYGKQQTTKSGRTYSSKVEPQATDAFFKYGFFIDPVSSVRIAQLESDPNVVNIPGTSNFFLPCDTNPSLFSAQVAVDMPRFYIKIDEEKSKESNEENNIEINVEETVDLLNLNRTSLNNLPQSFKNNVQQYIKDKGFSDTDFNNFIIDQVEQVDRNSKTFYKVTMYVRNKLKKNFSFEFDPESNIIEQGYYKVWKDRDIKTINTKTFIKEYCNNPELDEKVKKSLLSYIESDKFDANNLDRNIINNDLNEAILAKLDSLNNDC